MKNRQSIAAVRTFGIMLTICFLRQDSIDETMDASAMDVISVVDPISLEARRCTRRH